MCITEDKLVESYGKATPRERFRLIYKNYSIFPQLVLSGKLNDAPSGRLF